MMLDLFDDPVTTVLLGLAALTASILDAAVGGGGLISIPALLMTGWPLPLVLGTNKLASAFGAAAATLNFHRRGKIHGPLAWSLFPVAVLSSGAGAWTVGFFPSSLLRPLVVGLLFVVLVFSLRRKKWGDQSSYIGTAGLKKFLFVLAAASLGFYDGFFGPGTGSFLIFVFITLGFDFTTAAGNAKVLNWGSNLGALGVFAYMGRVRWDVGLYMGLIMIVGSWLGSQMALRGGVRYLKPVFVLVTLALLGKVSYDLVTSWMGGG